MTTKSVNQGTPGLTIHDRYWRGDDARAHIEQRLCDEFVRTISLASPLGALDPREEKRIRREALLEFAAEHGITTRTVKEDMQIIDAVETIQAIDEDVAEAILDETLRVTPRELLRMAASPSRELKKAVRGLRETLRDLCEHHYKFGFLPG